MTNGRSVFVLLNPAAGRGRRAARLDHYFDLLARALPAFDHAWTQAAGDEVKLVDKALAEGCDTIVAVGGDGTWSLVADRILQSGRRDVALGLLPTGTGNDFGKSLGVRHERVEEIVRAVAEGRTRRVDVGRAGERHFLNVVGMGFDIAVIDDAERTPILRGDALYKFCAIKQLFRFPGIPLAVDESGREPHLMLVIANGNYFGGSFHIAPDASLCDGKLDAVSIFDAGPFERAKLFGQVGKGEHVKAEKVRIQQAPAFRTGFAGTAPLRAGRRGL